MLIHQEKLKFYVKHSTLKQKEIRTKQQKDIAKYKKQRNLVVKLDRETKLHYFNNLETSKNSKPFWDKCRPVSKYLLVNSDEITRTFNKHFAETLEKLNAFEWPSNNEDLTEETLTKII